jgi:hypothetical protein
LRKFHTATLRRPAHAFNEGVLEQKCFLLDSKEGLKDFFNFSKREILIEDDLDTINFITDINSRKLRDAEVLSLVAANAVPGNMLDIGTHHGRSAARMAANSPQSTVYTVNIPPEEYDEGGKLKTDCLSRDEIGSFYRSKNLSNIEQIYANTKTWIIPDHINNVSLVYVDGCHDKEFVYSDTRLILDRVRPGGFILWHDCTPIYRHHFEWIDEVMQGIEWLLKEKIIVGNILNVKNSWIGIFKKEL